MDCEAVLGEEDHDYSQHITGWFDQKIGTYWDGIPTADDKYGEADVCSKCGAFKNFVPGTAPIVDISKAKPAVEEGKSYTQDEAKIITLKDEKGETVDKNSYTVSVETSKKDENKWTVIFDPINGRSTGKISIDVIKAKVHNHSYTSKITTAATCTKDGVMTYTCSCGNSYTEAIKATGHQYSATLVRPTATTIGYTLYTCIICGDSYKDSFTDKLHKHSYTSKVTKEVTCTKEGEMTYTCECGDSYTEAIKTVAHKYVKKVVSPTYTAQGYTQHTCSVCGK